MQSTITARGQTVIPAKIRHRFNLSPADKLEWIVEGNLIRIVPVQADSIAAFRGMGKAAARLLADRQQDRERE